MTGLNSMIGCVFVIRYTSKLSNGVKFQPLGLFLMLEGLKFQTLGGCRYKYYVWKNVEESALAKCFPLLNWIRQQRFHTSQKKNTDTSEGLPVVDHSPNTPSVYQRHRGAFLANENAQVPGMTTIRWLLGKSSQLVSILSDWSPCISHKRAIWKRSHNLIGDLLKMVISHALTGMILQKNKP